MIEDGNGVIVSFDETKENRNITKTSISRCFVKKT